MTDRVPPPAPYRVPTMAEIAKTKPNGYRLVSTFSGCGGSCLGFRMAGFRTLWASEFIDAARETYQANHPGVPVDGRDIREVTADDILTATGLARGELDVFEGSPPCASFSTSGKRSQSWGETKQYSDSSQRVDDLFYEYVRLVDGLQPRVFVAENVSGLVKGVAKGYFKRIFERLEQAGYVVGSQLLDAQWLGVPQGRQRIIFVGVRRDLGLAPAFPTPLPYFYSVRDAIGDLVGGQIVSVNVGRGRRQSPDKPSPTILTHGNLHTRSERSIVVVPDGDGPSIEGYAIHREWKKLRQGQQSERYFNLVRPHQDRPSPTITQLGGSNPGVASVTHPLEPRKFTIAELRRVCGFPDQFVLTGSYSQQWERLGRAVPPLMMAAVARVVQEQILDRLR